MNPMNLNTVNRDWPEETRQALILLQLYLCCQSDMLQDLGVPGNTIYRELSQTIGDITSKGPAALEALVDSATAQSSLLHQAVNKGIL